MLLSLLIACVVGSDPAPSPASPSGELAAQAAPIADQAAAVEELATRIEARTDELRREVAAGKTSQVEAVAELRGLVEELDTAHGQLQAAVTALEEETRGAAGMAPPEPLETRR